MDYYVLRGGAPVAVGPEEWSAWLKRTDRRLAVTKMAGCEISTVFLGVDHAIGEGAPVLWETRVFGGPLDGEIGRYASEASARVGHNTMVERCRAALGGVKRGQV